MTRIKLVWRLFPAFILIGVICLMAATWYTASSWRTFYLAAESTQFFPEADDLHIDGAV